MLSRAVLPLTRPNVLASAVRVGSLSAQRPRWYAKGKGKAPYKLPESMKRKETNANNPQSAEKPQQTQYTPEQPEFDTKAKAESEIDAAESSSTVRYTHLYSSTNLLSDMMPFLARAGGSSQQALA